jgi:hypothetical protein
MAFAAMFASSAVQFIGSLVQALEMGSMLNNIGLIRPSCNQNASFVGSRRCIPTVTRLGSKTSAGWHTHLQSSHIN